MVDFAAAISHVITVGPKPAFMPCNWRCAGAATWTRRRRTCWTRPARSTCVRCCARSLPRCFTGDHNMVEAGTAFVTGNAATRPQDGAGMLWAQRAWIENRWHEAVLMRVGEDGNWASVQTGVDA